MCTDNWVSVFLADMLCKYTQVSCIYLLIIFFLSQWITKGCKWCFHISEEGLFFFLLPIYHTIISIKIVEIMLWFSSNYTLNSNSLWIFMEFMMVLLFIQVITSSWCSEMSRTLCVVPIRRNNWVPLTQLSSFRFPFNLLGHEV